MIKKLSLVLLLIAVSSQVFAVGVIFKSLAGLLIRTPAGTVGRIAGIAELLEKVPSATELTANAGTDLQIGTAPKVPIEVAQTYTPSSLANSIAGLSAKNANALAPLSIQGLSLQNGVIHKQNPSTFVSPTILAPYTNSSSTFQKFTICGVVYGDLVAAATKHYRISGGSGCPGSNASVTISNIVKTSAATLNYHWVLSPSGAQGNYTLGSGSEYTCPSDQTASSSGTCVTKCPTGTYNGSQCEIPGAMVPATNTDIKDAVEADLTNNPAQQSPVFDVLHENGELPAPDSVSVSGPSSQPAGTSSTTRQNPDGSTDTITETKTNNFTYNNNEVSVNQTTTTTTTNNTTNQTTTTTTINNPVDVTNTTETPPTETDICKLHPEILACKELGSNEPNNLIETSIPISLNPTSLGIGTCPSPKTLNLSSGNVIMSYQPYCDFASMINPLIVGFSWLAAGFMVISNVRREG